MMSPSVGTMRPQSRTPLTTEALVGSADGVLAADSLQLSPYLNILLVEQNFPAQGYVFSQDL